MRQKPYIETFTNATHARLKNKRVSVFYEEKDTVIIEFTTISNSLKPKAFHEVLKNKAVITGVKLSLESARALQLALTNELTKSGELWVKKNQL